MEKRENKTPAEEPKKGTSKTTLIAAVAVIVIIVVYYGILYLPDILAAPKYEDNPKTFVHISYGDIDKSIAVPVNTLGYTKNDVIAYFDDVALRIESGGSISVSKWRNPIKIFVRGIPSEADLATMQFIFDGLKNIPGFPGIETTTDEASANSFIHFYMQEEYHQLERGYFLVSTNGFAAKEKKNGGEILQTTIGINCEREQHYRSGVIMEELLQSLGLQNDSWIYDFSLFYQGKNELDEPADIDWLLVELLYHPAIRLNAGRSECLYTLRNLLVQ